MACASPGAEGNSKAISSASSGPKWTRGARWAAPEPLGGGISLARSVTLEGADNPPKVKLPMGRLNADARPGGFDVDASIAVVLAESSRTCFRPAWAKFQTSDPLIPTTKPL